MSANAGYATLQLIPSLRGAEGQIIGQLGGLGSNVDQAGAAAGAKYGSAFLKLAGPAVIGGAAAGLAGLGGAFDDQFDKIRVGTDATGAELKGLEGSFKNVLKTTATDFDTAGTAIAKLNQGLDLTGKPLEVLSKRFADVSRITDTDFNGNLEAGIKVMQNFNIPAEAQAGALDKIYRASQASGVSFADLSSQLASNGVVLRQVGLDYTQSTALLASLGKAGIETSDVMPGLSKAMATAAKEGKSADDVFRSTFDRIKGAKSETAAASVAMEVFGARAGPKLAALIREGKFSVDEMLGAVNNGNETIAKAAKETADWGEKWNIIKNKVLVFIEPLATRVFNAIGTGLGVLEEVSGAIGEDGLAGAADLFREKFDSLPGPVKAALGVVAAAFAVVAVNATRAGVQASISAAKQVAAWVATQVASAASTAVTVAQFTLQIGRWIAMGVVAAAQGAIVVAGWAAIAARAAASTALTLVQFGVQIAQWIVLGATALAQAALVAAAWLISMGPIILVGAAVVGLVALIVKNWDAIYATISGAATKVIDFLQANWPTILAIITGPIGLAVLAISRNWDTIKSAASAAVEWVRDRFNSLVSFITGLPGKIASGAKGMFDGILNAAKAVFGGVARLWNNTVGKLSFRAPSWVPHFGGKGFDVPDIPGYARGGQMDGLAIVGEEGTELVSGKGRVDTNRTLRSMIQDAIRDAGINRASGDDRPLVVQLTLDGRVLAEWASESLEDRRLERV